MSSPPKSSISPSPSKKSVHQKIASVLTSSSSSGGSNPKPFIKNKSQTTSSIVFPSFRFSPESEEIREVTNIVEQGGEGDEGSGSSTGADGEGAGAALLDGIGSVETPPTATTKSGGDISPLKEYLLKHKWANKWDKRSLSLDLDLKGKLFTALEDKRKSFVSQFLNEDEEEDINMSVHQPMTPLTTSCSIPEQLVVGSSSSNNNALSSTDTDYGYDQDEDVSVRSDTVLFRHHSSRGSSTSNQRRTYNFDEENCPDYFDYEDDFDDDYDVVVEEEITGSTNKKPTIPPLKLDATDLKDNLVVVEEIGVDCCEVDDIMMLMGGEEGASTSRSSLLKEFVLPPESLQERFEGLPTLYNPPSIVIGLRKYPIQEIASTAGGAGDAVIESLQEEDGSGGGDGVYYRKRTDRSDYTVRGLVRNILLDIVYHPWVKYWIGLLAAVVTLDFGGIVGRFIWFLLGIGGTVICSRALWKGEWADGSDDVDDESGGSSNESLVVLEGGKSSQVTNGNNPTSSSAFSLYSSSGFGGGKSTTSTSVLVGEQQKRASPGIGNGLKWKSQGWLLTLNTPEPKQNPYPDYNPFRNHLRDTKTVFARLNGPYLTISVPHPRHRIPKRRLWSDPVINSEHIFIRHQQYDLTGAKVQVVPLGLAKKRVWCKKYPIGITFVCSDKFCGELIGGVGGKDSPVHGADGDVSGSNSGGAGNDTVGRVSFTKDEKGNEKVKVGGGLGEKPKGEVFKDPGNCCGKTIYLFARCDREKDDWFRRLIAASKIKLPAQPTSPPANSSKDFSHFIRYMQRTCPTMMVAPSLFTPSPSPSSPRVTPTNDLLYENVSMHHISQNLQESTSLPSSQPSSRKSTPDKLESFHFTPGDVTMNPSYLNALIGRLFYDFLQSDKWNEKVKKLIDRKLFFIRKPAMVQSLKVKSLDFGDSLPLINHTSTPVLDSQGLWVDLDIGFVGNIVITLEAFINIMKMGVSWDEERLQSDLSRAENHRGSAGSSGHKTGGGGGNTSNSSPLSKSPSKHAMFDSEADDSGESSESDDDVDLEEAETNEKSNTTKPASDNVSKSGTASNANVATGGRGKLLKYADSFAKSSVMRNKHVQKLVTGIAATPILLTVEIRRVVGSVAVNIPPVPNDRVWIGFRSNPVIDINVRPKVGQRVVSLSQVTEWIKKKILLEFQRVMVCPNMMDITIPLMEFQLPK